MIRDTRYIFFGTPRFAAIILEKLIRAGIPPVALVCNPDRPTGRKKIITPPPTKQLVANRPSTRAKLGAGRSKLQIEILQPDDISAIRDKLFALRPDLSIVAAYSKILPREILAIPRLGTIGVHPSLLPKYRGPSPIQSAILAGEEETGVSLFLMDEQVDNGPIISSKKLVVSSKDNYETLEKKLAELAGDLLVEILPKFVEDESAPLPRSIHQDVLRGLPQDQSQATYTKKFTTEDALIPEEELVTATSGNSPDKALEIDRKIRALNPEPGVFSRLNGQEIKILGATLENNQLKLKKIQQPGKNPVDL